MIMNKEYKDFLNSQLELPYYKKIISFLNYEIANNKIIYPNVEKRFQAFNITPFNKVKVVKFGQDPYHSKNVADELAFSSNETRTPKSLANIFKELKNEYFDIELDTNSLSSWANQGVLLLNTSLSVEEGKPNSHSKIGWNIFIENFIEYLNSNKDFLIFILWGNHAKKLKPFISPKFHILESPHPSPFSVNKGFLGNNHFQKVNQILRKENLQEIDWNLK